MWRDGSAMYHTGMMRALGLPELVFLFALIVLVVMLTRARDRARRGAPYSNPQGQATGVRYCRHCGNSLIQPPEAPFCPFCGQRVA